ncbi:MAG: FtsK/SpoIIIE domain-containing protein [Dermatophilaceae bacterium]
MPTEPRPDLDQPCRLVWHVRLPEATAPVRIGVAVQAHATLAHLRVALREAFPASARHTAVVVAGRRLDDSALLGHPPLLDGATLNLGDGAVPGARPTPLLSAHVVGGPDTGAVVDLPPGEHRIGRATEASIRLTDADVSRVHAVLRVQGPEVTVRDLGSSNGTRVEGVPVDVAPRTVPVGARLRVGGSTLVLRTADAVPAVVRADGRGHLLVNRPPAVATTHPTRTVAMPTPPNDPPPARLPLLAMALPAVLAGVLAAVLRSPTMLLFGLTSPLLVLGQWVADRRGRRKERRTAHAEYQRDRAQAEVDLADALATEAAWRLADEPDPAQLLGTARQPGARLWANDARRDGLRARVGLGVVEAHTTTTGTPDPVCRLGPVPVTVDLGVPGGVGLAGPRERVLGLAHALVGRLAVRYSPADLRIRVVHRSEDGRHWDWVGALPHAGTDDARDRIPTPSTPDSVDIPAAQRDWAGPRTLVIVDRAAEWRTDPALGRLLANGHRHGCAVLALDATPAHLPVEARTVVDLSEPTAYLRVAGHEPVEIDPDSVGPTWSGQVAQALAPLRDPAAALDLDSGPAPSDVSLLRLLRLDCPTTELLARRWRERPRSTALPLGVDGHGPVLVDLAADGPHALVGGTTGSGKSELLVSLVAGLAVLNRPDELVFVLVDYKGGAAFEGTRLLPHVVGLVTDLDAALTERALVSLGAELRRRERLLADHGAADLAAYQRSRGPAAPPVPRLVVVVDEFRALAQDLPDFVDGLVRIAALGRSLGLHVVVATQRPAGVVTADMRANLGLRIALRVRDGVDSLDVIDTVDAAGLPAASPGRAYLRTPDRGPTQLQTARVTGRTAAPTPVRITDIDGVPVVRRATGPTDLARLVAAAVDATRELGIEPIPSPWLSPLPDRLDAADLVATSGEAVLGLADDPAAQRQLPLTWSPRRDGALAVVGRPKSGRSSALRAVALALARAFSPTAVHLYAVHLGGLDGLPSLAHLGGVVRGDEPADVERLLALLAEPTAGPSDHAVQVLLVDDWERCHAALLAARRPTTSDALTALARAGPAGVVVVAAGDRSVFGGAGAAAFPGSIVLLPADPLDLALSGIPPRALPRDPPPGRAVDTRSGLIVQMAQPDLVAPQGDPWSPQGGRVHAAPLPRPLRPLPTDVDAADLHPTTTIPLPIAVGGPDLGPCGLDPSAGDRRVAVLGEPVTGRTTTLLTLAHVLTATGRPVALVTTDGGPHPPGTSVVHPSDADALVRLRRAHPALAVLVEDLPGLDEGPLAPVLAEIERILDEDDGMLVVAGSARRILESGLGLLARVARHGCGLLLGPGQPGDERALARAGIPACGTHRGRAVLVRRGRATAVQVARVRDPQSGG